MGGAVFLPYCLTWDQTMVEVTKIMATSFKWSHALTATLSSPNPAAGHPWPTPPLETPGHSQACLGQSLVGSLLLYPGSWSTQGFVCALQESVFPVLCKFWQLYGGLMVTSSKRTYAMPRSTAPRAPVPAPAAVLCSPIPQQTLKYSSGSVFVGSGSWCTQVLFEPSKYLWQIWDLILNMILPFLPSCWGFSFALERGVLLFCGIQQSSVKGCSAVSCNFGVLSGEDELTSFYSTWHPHQKTMVWWTEGTLMPAVAHRGHWLGLCKSSLGGCCEFCLYQFKILSIRKFVADSMEANYQCFQN